TRPAVAARSALTSRPSTVKVLSPALIAYRFMRQAARYIACRTAIACCQSSAVEPQMTRPIQGLCHSVSLDFRPQSTRINPSSNGLSRRSQGCPCGKRGSSEIDLESPQHYRNSAEGPVEI